MRRSRVLPMIALAALSACAKGDQREFDVATVDPNAAVRTEAPELPPLPQDAAVPVPGSKPVAGVAFMATGPVNVEEGTQRQLDLKSLVGLNFAQIQSLLGEPNGRGEKPPGKVWTYSNDSCVLNVFFYADINTREFRALTYEVAAGNTRQTDPMKLNEEASDQCLQQLKPGM
jgi:hypothetical protein